MPIALIVAAVIMLVGIVGVVMSRDNWRWQNITLASLVLLFSVLFFYLGAKNLAVQKTWRNEIEAYKKQITSSEQEIEKLRNGEGDEPSIYERQRMVKTIMQGRGRVWAEAQCRDVAPDGSLLVDIAQPTPPGLADKTILFVFDGTESNAGGLFLGEFEVIKVDNQQVTLAPVLTLRTAQTALLQQRKNKPLVLYEIMPTDSHDLYAKLPPDERTAKFSNAVPANVKQEFANDGNPPEGAADGERIWRRVKALRSFDVTFGAGENVETHTVNEGTELILDPDSANERITAGDVAPVEGNDKVYRRTLRDYAKLHRELNLRIDSLMRKIAETTAQLAVVQAAQEKANADLAFREKERDQLRSDKTRFLAENERVRAHVAALEQKVKEIGAELRKTYDENIKLEAELVQLSYELVNRIEKPVANSQ